MDLDDLRAFAFASDLGSLAGAAKAMSESKATISRRITRLEQSLRATLLRRSTRGIETTDAGAAYRLRLADLFERLDDANSAARNGGRSTPSGQLRITIAPGFSGALARTFAAFSSRYPEISLVVHVSSRFVDLERESVDIAIRASAKLTDSSLLAVRVRSPELEGIFVAAPSYLAQHEAPVIPEDLRAHRFLAIAEAGEPYAMTLVHRGIRGSTPSMKRVEVTCPLALAGTDIEFIKEMAVHGAGIAMVPRPSVQREIADGPLVHVLKDYSWPSQKLFLVHRGAPYTPLKVRTFIDFLRTDLDSPAPLAVAHSATGVAKVTIPRKKSAT